MPTTATKKNSTSTTQAQLLCKELLAPLQRVIGLVERRQTMPILSNVLVRINGHQLAITGTDLEVELLGYQTLRQDVGNLEFTVSAKKLLDICRSLPEESFLSITLSNHALQLSCGDSVFSLQTLPVADFPSSENDKAILELTLPQKTLKQLIQKTSFAMAQQDVRFYLNGLFLDLNETTLKAVTTDGHRLAFDQETLKEPIRQRTKIILPRKGVLELSKLLELNEEPVAISISKNHFNAKTKTFSFSSELIEGVYPDYAQVIPKNKTCTVKIDRALLKQALIRTAILASDQHRGVSLAFSNERLCLTLNNGERESYEEKIPVELSPKNASLTVGLNLHYINDVINVVESTQIIFHINNEQSGVLLEADAQKNNTIYVIMPMKI